MATLQTLFLERPQVIDRPAIVEAIIAANKARGAYLIPGTRVSQHRSQYVHPQRTRSV